MKNILILIISLSIFHSCSKETDDSNTDILPYFPVQAKVMGATENDIGAPIEGVGITMGTNYTVSLDNGFFFFDQQSLNSEGTLLKASKIDFYDSYKMIQPVPNVNSLVVFQMISRKLITSFDNANGGVALLNQGASITFSPNSFVSESGQSYTGAVSVFARYIDPSDLINTENTIPSDLRSLSLDGDIGQILPVGIIQAEIEGANGIQLKLRPGATAEVSFPLAIGSDTDYPESVDLFFLNEENGYWQESGEGNFANAAYIAEVDHFSYWLVGNQAPKIELELTVLTTAGTPFQGNVSLSSNTYYCTMPDPNTTTCIGWCCIPGIVNSNGDIFGGVPKDMEFQLNIWDRDGCGNSNIIYSEPLGPFSSDAQETVIVTPSDYSQSYKEVQVSGNFINCDGDPVINGLMKADGRYYALGFDGSFNLSFLVCDSKAEIEIEAFDFDAGKTYGVETIAIPDPDLNIINLNDTEICITLDEYIIVESSNCENTFVLVDFDQYYIVGNSQDFSTSIMINFGDPNNPNSFINITQTGTYPIQTESDIDCGGGISMWNMGSEITVTSFPLSIGDYLEGNFSGTINGGTAVTGSYRIKNN